MTDRNTRSITRPSGRSTVDQGLFVTLVVLLLVASSNIGLINIRLAIKAGDGGNLLGIRDALLAMVLGLGMLRLLKQSHTVLHNPLAKITFLVACLSPIAALVGILNGGQTLTVARDLVTMMGWLLAYIIGTNIKTKTMLESVWNAIFWIGILVAVGVFIEAATFGEIRVVTPADVVSATGRSTPSGWPIMMLSASIAMTRLLLNQAAFSKGDLRDLLFLVIIFVASLLTQSRTLLVGLAGGFIAFILIAMVTKKQRLRMTGLGLILAAIPIIVGATFLVGERLIRTDFTDQFMARYSVLESVNSLVEYSKEDTRRTEVELGFKRYVSSPLLGLGLGSPYREQIYISFEDFQEEDSAILVHNVFAFFLFRYGPLGLFLFSLLCVRFIWSLFQAFHDTTNCSAYGIGLSIGLVNLVMCSFFGSVFSSTYGVPVTMICIGTLIAYEEGRARTEGISREGGIS